MKKQKPLRPDQNELLLEVLKKRAPELIEVVFARATENLLERQERERLCGLLGAEFAETGVDAEFEATPRGLRLEALLDVLNRPNTLP